MIENENNDTESTPPMTNEMTNIEGSTGKLELSPKKYSIQVKNKGGQKNLEKSNFI